MLNEWDFFITLTLNKEKIDRYDSLEVRKKTLKWLDNHSTRNGFKYIVVSELHKDGAIHFHGLIKLNEKSTLKLVNSGKKDKNGRAIFNLLNWNLGFTTAVKLDNNSVAISHYITKYITKSTEKTFGNYYWSSRNLLREPPTQYYNMDYEKDLILQLADGQVIEINDILKLKPYVQTDENNQVLSWFRYLDI